MNAKKAKSVRQSLTRMNVDWRDADYEEVMIGKNPTGQIVLKKSCGRAKYKFVKARWI